MTAAAAVAAAVAGLVNQAIKSMAPLHPTFSISVESNYLGIRNLFETGIREPVFLLSFLFVRHAELNAFTDRGSVTGEI